MHPLQSCPTTALMLCPKNLHLLKYKIPDFTSQTEAGTSYLSSCLPSSLLARQLPVTHNTHFLFLFSILPTRRDHESLSRFTGSHPKQALLSQFHLKVLHPSPLSCSLPSNLPSHSTALSAQIRSCSSAQCWQLWSLQQCTDAQSQN